MFFLVVYDDTFWCKQILQAKPFLELENINELVDQQLGGVYDTRQMQRAVLTASLCVRQSAVWRPCMSQVCGFVHSFVINFSGYI